MRKSFIAAALLLGLLTVPMAAHAQTFLTPFAGVTFGKDAPSERPTVGGSLLFMGDVAGLEIEVSHTPDFFGDSDAFDFASGGNVTSLSANLVLGVGTGSVRPYVTGGFGLLSSRIDSADDLFEDVSDNGLGINAGGGIILMVHDRVGLRGDLRYFRGFEAIDFDEAEIELDNFDFWRGYGGLVFQF